MPKQSFLLVSLKEDKAKELAQVISNESCRKILDYLAEKQDATESEISKDLQFPISTVHYNLQHLMKAGIINVDEFHYSEKGKEVNHYKLANKYIIIAPKTTYGIKEKLRSILPVSLLALIGAGFIQIYTKYFRPVAGFMKAAAPMMDEGVREAAPAAEPILEKAPEVAVGVMKSAASPMIEAVTTAKPLAEKGVEEGVKAAIERVPEVTQQVIQAEPNLALWFLFGCVFVIVLVVIFELIKSKREK